MEISKKVRIGPLPYLVIVLSLMLWGYISDNVPKSQDRSYYDFVCEATIAIMALVTIFIVSKIDKPRGIRNIFLAAFFLIYIALFVDALDEIFIFSPLITNLFENIPQVLGCIIIPWGVAKWFSYNKEVHDKLKQLSTIDDLTGALNRRAFVEIATEEIERTKRHQRPLSLVIVDFDFFKKVNDSHGHSVGDVVLAKVCGEITKILRVSDIFCRWGGEEFCIVLPETNKDQCYEFAEKIRKHIGRTTFELPKAQLTITASLGCSSLSPEDKSLARLIERADKALYQSKENGRNCVTLS